MDVSISLKFMLIGNASRRGKRVVFNAARRYSVLLRYPGATAIISRRSLILRKDIAKTPHIRTCNSRISVFGHLSSVAYATAPIISRLSGLWGGERRPWRALPLLCRGAAGYRNSRTLPREGGGSWHLLVSCRGSRLRSCARPMS